MAKEMIISKELQEASERLALVIGVNPLVPVLTKANAVIAVREWLKLPEVYEKIIQLKDTNSGFKTDEKPGSTPYDQRTITNCVTDALLAGFNLVGNEFNIIKGNMMGVLNGYSRLVREFENDKIKVISVELSLSWLVLFFELGIQLHLQVEPMLHHGLLVSYPKAESLCLEERFLHTALAIYFQQHHPYHHQNQLQIRTCSTS